MGYAANCIASTGGTLAHPYRSNVRCSTTKAALTFSFRPSLVQPSTASTTSISKDVSLLVKLRSAEIECAPIHVLQRKIIWWLS